MALNASSHTLLTSTALSSSLTLDAHSLITAVPLSSGKSTSAHYLISATPLAGQKTVSAHYIVSAVSIHQRIFLNYLEGGEIYGVHSYDLALATGPIPEHNPYRPTIPESLIGLGEDYYDYAKENQEILREQHNITQAGDTTFPYQLFIGTHDDQHYRLGAIGRFYHADYGIIHCRYVKFDEMIPVDLPHCPVGLFTTAKVDGLEWRVTNNIAKSSADLVVGISAPFLLPVDGKFGWVIVDGPNLQPVRNDSTTQTIGEAFAWSAAGSVSNTAVGKVIGRRVNKTKSDLTIDVGQMWVTLESFSEAKIRQVIDDQTKSLLDAIHVLQDSIGDLPASDELQALNNLLTSLTLKVNLEIGNRVAADQAIQAQLNNLGVVTPQDLQNAVTNAANALASAVTNLQNQIDVISAAANHALELANQALNIDLSGIQNQINTLQLFVNNERARAKGRFPVVDGSVPPNLAYAEDGSLIYVETF